MGACQRRTRAHRGLSVPVRLPSPRRGGGVLRLLLLVLLLLPAGCAGETAPVRGTPLPLAAANPPDRLGPLGFAGALEVTSSDRRFGGISGMLVDRDFRLTAISDTGMWVTARLLIEGDRLIGISGLDLLAIRDGAGQQLARGFMADAESLARLPDGRLLVGFERWARLRAFAAPGAPGLYFQAPPGVEQLAANEGMEALTLLADGRLLVIEEGLDSALPRHAWLGGAPGWTGLRYRAEQGFRPTDAAGLPDGGALVLERSFSLFGGFAGRIMHLPASQLGAAGPGTTLQPRELARLAPPLLADNFEAIAVAPRASGGVWVFVASDDNFHPLQRTLLLAFILDQAPP